MSTLLHAVALAVAVDADGPLAGALILGESGSGKSSLALSAVETCPWRRTALVADDQVLLEEAGNRITARSPKKIAGLVEIRGYGPAPVRTAASVAIMIVFDLAVAVERVPTPTEFRPLGDLSAPLYPFQWKGAETSAPHRLRRIIATLLSGQTPRCIVDVGR